MIRVDARRWMLPGLLLSLAMTTAQAVPVIPGAAGFGMNTSAGRGGAVYRVTNLNASGAGSLKACIDAEGARTCIFDVSGSIRLTSEMTIRHGKLTIAGQTAPSPGIMIRGAAFKIHASDVLIQHLRFRIGDDLTGPDPANRDALKIEGAADRMVKNIVIDHCSFSWSIDEIVSVWGPHDNITFTNNIFAEPLHDSLHPTDDGTGVEPHGFGVLLGSSPSGGRVTMVGNLFAHIVERNPLSRARELVYVNNLVYDRSHMDLDLQSEPSYVTKTSVVGNHFLRGPSNVRQTPPLHVRTSGSLTLYPGSRVYVENNYSPDTGNALDQILQLTGGNVLSGLITTTTKPTWNSALVVTSTANNGVYNNVLKNAGARPADRDRVDKRIVWEVKNNGGYTVNCVAVDGSARCEKNAGGWPGYTKNTRVLKLPTNHATMNSSGYSNLELWLHQLDAQINGVVQTNAPSAPSAMLVQ